jgi:hypothetical protein
LLLVAHNVIEQLTGTVVLVRMRVIAADRFWSLFRIPLVWLDEFPVHYQNQKRIKLWDESCVRVCVWPGTDFVHLCACGKTWSQHNLDSLLFVGS